MVLGDPESPASSHAVAAWACCRARPSRHLFSSLGAGCSSVRLPSGLLSETTKICGASGSLQGHRPPRADQARGSCRKAKRTQMKGLSGACSCEVVAKMRSTCTTPSAAGLSSSCQPGLLTNTLPGGGPRLSCELVLPLPMAPPRALTGRPGSGCELLRVCAGPPGCACACCVRGLRCGSCTLAASSAARCRGLAYSSRAQPALSCGVWPSEGGSCGHMRGCSLPHDMRRALQRESRRRCYAARCAELTERCRLGWPNQLLTAASEALGQGAAPRRGATRSLWTASCGAQHGAEPRGAARLSRGAPGHRARWPTGFWPAAGAWAAPGGCGQRTQT